MGKIFKIRIGHNGSGMGSGWFLETVDVKHLVMALVPKEKKKEEKKKKKKKKMDEGNEDEDGGEEVQEVVLTYHFPCCRWLAGDEEDGELLVELLPEDSDELEGTEFNKCDADEREVLRTVEVRNSNIGTKGYFQEKRHTSDEMWKTRWSMHSYKNGIHEHKVLLNKMKYFD